MRGCDTTRQRSKPAYQRTTINTKIQTLYPPSHETERTEEVIDSSHHNLWEGQTLPFPSWVTGIIIPKVWRELKPTRGLFLMSQWGLKHQGVRAWSTGEPTTTGRCYRPLLPMIVAWSLGIIFNRHSFSVCPSSLCFTVPFPGETM